MNKLLLFLTFLTGISSGFPKMNPAHFEIDSLIQNSKVNETIEDIKIGFIKSDVSKISRYISSQVYLSLLTGVSGYYSSNQAYYILEKFLKDYSVISFSFERLSINSTTPYATGTYYYEHKGNRSEAKVYLSLKLLYDSWEITQISID